MEQFLARSHSVRPIRKLVFVSADDSTRSHPTIKHGDIFVVMRQDDDDEHTTAASEQQVKTHHMECASTVHFLYIRSPLMTNTAGNVFG